MHLHDIKLPKGAKQRMPQLRRTRPGYADDQASRMSPARMHDGGGALVSDEPRVGRRIGRALGGDQQNMLPRRQSGACIQKIAVALQSQ
jgi:hypothetical protein